MASNGDAATGVVPDSSDGGGGGGGSVGPGSEKLKRIGDWIFGETLGQGSFGKVKLAHHAKTKEKVAIKIVDKSGIANVEDVERVYRETFILTTLKHGNIIKLFEVLDTPRSIMLVMEYAGGGELFSYVAAKHRLGELESCRLFQQIISGVEYCHRAKIIHRDLKLENILLDKSGQVKIADFGLSNSIKFGQKMDTSCLTGDHSVLVRHRGWLPIGRVQRGDFVWALGFLGAQTAGWTRVTGTVLRQLEQDEALVHFAAGDDVDLLVTLDHQMWTMDPDTEAWASEPAESVAHNRHVLAAAPALDSERFRWDLPFLANDGVDSDSDTDASADDAWCEFLGLFLGCGRLAMDRLQQDGYNDDGKCVVLACDPSPNAHFTKRLGSTLSRLGWLCDNEADAHDSRATDTTRPYFFRRNEPDSFVAYHAQLYDFLWPMLASPLDCSVSPAPLPLAAQWCTALAHDTADKKPRGHHLMAAPEVLLPHHDADPAPPPAFAPASAPAHSGTAQLREWGRRRLQISSPPDGDGAAVPPAHAIAAVPVAPASSSADASSSPDLVSLFGSVADLAHNVEQTRVADSALSSRAVARPCVRRVLTADASEPLTSNDPIRVLLQLHSPTPDALPLLAQSIRDSGLSTGPHLALADLVPIDLRDQEALPLLDECLHTPAPAYLPVARASVRAALDSGAGVVVAFGAYACQRFNELPKAAPASYLDGIRCYRVETTVVVEAPHPGVCAPATMLHVTRALRVAQQLADGSSLPPPSLAPLSWPLAAAAQPPLSTEDAASISKLLCHPAVAAENDALPLSSSPSSLPAHRTMSYEWRFHLGPSQCRAVIRGWAMAVADDAADDEQQRSDQLDCDRPRLRGCTTSQLLVDDLTMLAARCGYPCVVSMHDHLTAPCAKEEAAQSPPTFWRLDFRQDQAVDAPCVGVSVPLTGPSGPLLLRDHGHTHVYCLTVESGNFLTRRTAIPGRPSPATFVGNCGTPSYTCPEQINGKKYVGSSADIWSLGVILFAMISGFLPFEAAGIPALFRKIKSRQYKCPSYLSREATDLIDRMLTLDPEKRASLAELRNHPWVLMEFTELADQIEAMPPVTPDMVSEARAQCMAVGDEQAQAAAAAAAAATAANHTQTRSKYAHHKSNSVAITGSSVSRALALPSQSADSLSGSASPSPVPDDGDGRDGSSSADREHSHGAGGPYSISSASSSTSSSAAVAAGMRPRERGASVSFGVGGGISMGLGKGTPLIPGAANIAKGFRDLRNGGGGGAGGGIGDRYSPSFSPLGSSGAAGGSGGPVSAPGKPRAMSIFDKLSVRVSSDSGGSGSAKHGEILSAGALGSGGPGALNSRYPRFSPPTSAPSEDGRVRFPPIGASPSISPSLLESSSAGGGGGGGTKSGGSRATTAHGGRDARARRPSEFGGSGAPIPSYMQPTENATNHLLASEREEREKAEAESGSSGGRTRGRSSIIHAHAHPSPSNLGSKLRDRDRLGLGDVNEDFYSHHGGGGHASASSAGGAAARALVKTPRTRDIGGSQVPAYMLETNSSRQRGGTKQTDI